MRALTLTTSGDLSFLTSRTQIRAQRVGKAARSSPCGASAFGQLNRTADPAFRSGIRGEDARSLSWYEERLAVRGGRRQSDNAIIERHADAGMTEEVELFAREMSITGGKAFCWRKETFLHCVMTAAVARQQTLRLFCCTKERKRRYRRL